MSNYVTLLGAEDVARAGHNMAGAAEAMQRAVSNMETTLMLHQQFMTQWLQTLEQVLTDHAVRVGSQG